MLGIGARCCLRCQKRLLKRRSIAVCARGFQIQRTLEKPRCVYFAENARRSACVETMEIGDKNIALKVVKELGGKLIFDLQILL